MSEALKHYYLQQLGIQLWQSKNSLAPTNKSNWESLRQQVAACQACTLCETRTQTVFGVGDQEAELLIVGEAPGAQEDRLGEPFVGKAGHLLDAMLQAIGLDRQKVYIANVLKCRPPQNRDPLAGEVEKCTPFLRQQIALLQPKIILAVGRVAAQYLLKTDTSLTHLRNKSFTYGDQKVPLLVTYHPAYLLRSPGEKKKAYLDLLQVKKHLGI